tara:strand:- start:441 stop:587 length:147 start_codon:yes stop_codon:yes gene_type:complete
LFIVLELGEGVKLALLFPHPIKMTNKNVDINSFMIYSLLNVKILLSII